MPRAAYDPYTIPSIEPQAFPGGIMIPNQSRYLEAEPMYEVVRQPMMDKLEGMDPRELRALALACANRARMAEEERELKYYREPFWYAVNIGAQGNDAAPILAGATSAAGQNVINIESGSNFEAYYGTRWTQNTVTGAINTSPFRSTVFYPGSKGITSEDRALADALRQNNAFGSAERPARYVWPRVFPASGDTSIRFTNDDVNPVNAQIVYFGNKVSCGKNPRKILAKPPYSREPFTFAISFLNAAANIGVNGNVQMLANADFELLYITQDSPAGNVGDFEVNLKEAGGGPKGLMDIPIRRDAGFGTIERPLILTYPRYYPRSSRILANLINRNFAGAVQTFQLSFHGNLII